MLIIFGFKIRYKTVGKAHFSCPYCHTDRTGEQQVARRWMTLFLIPVIPLKVIGELLRCTVCGHRFDMGDAFEVPTLDVQHEIFSNAARVVTVLVTQAGGGTNPALRAEAIRSIAPAHSGYNDASLDGDMASLTPAQLDSYVQPLAAFLEDAGKENLVAQVARVALAAGTITNEQRRIIEMTGSALGMRPVHITGVVSSVASRVENGPRLND